MEVTEKHMDVWENCLRIFEQIIDPHQYKTWFSKIKPVSFVDSTLTVEVPSDFFREWLENAFLKEIKMTLKRVIGADARLIYTTRMVNNQPNLNTPWGEGGDNPVNRELSVGEITKSINPGPYLYPGLKKVQINPNLNKVFNFTNLVCGDCNKLGIAAGKEIAEAPGKTPFNPLFIFGGSGLGKTHLAQAIGVEINAKFPDLVALYVTGNQFKTQYMDAVSVRNKLVDFMGFYNRIDVLIVDDIQDLMGQGSQNAFFNIFNHLHQHGKQLIFTSDRSPVELQNFEERLRSRFKWGLSVELKKPDYETRLSMLKSRSFREGIKISDEVLEYLAAHIKNSFRELEGALTSIVAHAVLEHSDCSLALAQRIIGNLVGEDESEDISVSSVQKTVCEYFNITLEQMLSNSRKRQVVQARHIAMFLCRNLIGRCSLSTIGEQFGGKDHSTVLHACTSVTDQMETDRMFRKYVNDIETMVTPSAN